MGCVVYWCCGDCVFVCDGVVGGGFGEDGCERVSRVFVRGVVRGDGGEFEFGVCVCVFVYGCGKR